MIALIAAAGALAAALFSLLRLFAGPTLYDRMASVNSIGAHIATACAAAGAWSGAQDFLDAAIAIVLGLTAFNAATLKVFQTRSFQTPLARLDAHGTEG